MTDCSYIEDPHTLNCDLHTSGVADRILQWLYHGIDEQDHHQLYRAWVIWLIENKKVRYIKYQHQTIVVSNTPIPYTTRGEYSASL